jgi:septal ring factor EnvC (AmiA/AmiB activator)
MLFTAGSLILQDKSIKGKQNELSELKKEISELENQISLKTAKEKENFSVLENYSRQNFLLNKVINKIKSEEKEKESEILYSLKIISDLEKEIESLQKNYARYVVAIYKSGKISELASLIDARSVEQALVRYKYLQKFSEQRRKDLDNLRNKKKELLTAKSLLEKEKVEKSLLAAAKINEEKQLLMKLNERKKIISSLKKDKVQLNIELEAKRNAEVKIKNLITKLIEEAERKAEEERIAREKVNKEKTSSASDIKKENSKEDYNLNLSTSGFTSFSTLKGKLTWPVNSGKIIRKFGENRNTQLNTVTLNYGVDIKTESDVNVKSVAEGIVSAIDWIPGYGSIIIITHRDNYRTVYSHLSEIFIKEGDKVKPGSLIAKVGESLEGSILHFEIWSSRNNQNPELWLAKR